MRFLSVPLLFLFLQTVHSWSWPFATEQSFPPSSSYTEDAPTIGIHLGSDLIRAAVVQNKTVSLIPLGNGVLSMPSIVNFAFDPPLVGNEVTETNTSHNVYGVERFLGRRFRDHMVQNVLKEGQLKIVQGMDDQVRLEVEKVVRGKGTLAKISPDEVVAILLGKVRKLASDHLGANVNKAAVSVPAEWGDEARAALKEVGAMAGLEIMRVSNEHTMAALGLSYDTVHENDREERILLVYNLGNQAFSATVLCYEEGVFEVLGSAANAHLGGISLNETGFAASLKLVNKAMKEAHVKKSDIQDVLLVGEAATGARPLLEKHFMAPFGTVDPQLAIVHGAAIMADIISSESEYLCHCLEVTYLTLGVETAGGIMWPIVKRGTTVPTKKWQNFTTAYDNQTSMLIQVYEGERRSTNRTHLLGAFELAGIEPAKKGLAQVEVAFEVDYRSPYRLKVSARYLENTTTVEIGPSDLSPLEMEALVEEGDLYEDFVDYNRYASYLNQSEREIGEIANHAYSNKTLE